MFLGIDINNEILKQQIEKVISFNSINERDINNFFNFEEEFISNKKFLTGIKHYIKIIFDKNYKQNIYQERYKKELFNLFKNYKQEVKKNYQKINDFEIDINKIYEYSNSITSYYFDKTIDELKVIHKDNKENKVLIQLVKDTSKLLVFQELVFFLIFDMGIIKKNKKQYIIFPTEIMLKNMRRRWFSFKLDDESKLSNYNIIVKSTKEIFISNITKKKKKEILETLSNHFIDKVLFLQFKYMNKINLPIEDIKKIQNICKFFAIIHMYDFHILLDKNSKRIKINDNIFKEFKIDFIVDEIININKTISYLNKGFTIDKEGNISIVKIADMYYIISLYIKKISNTFSNYIKNNVSIFFDEEYTRNHIMDNALEYYEVIGNSNFTEKPFQNIDVDLIIKDKFNNKYYFIQTKFTPFRERLAYLDEELKLFYKNQNLFQKALKQLSELKKYIDDEEFQQLLETKYLANYSSYNANSKNSHFIILHNVTNFDFSLKDGIAMYEWNSFRNLLQRGNLNFTHSNNDLNDNFKFNSNLILEDVDSVIEKYFTDIPILSESYRNSWKKFILEEVNLKIFDFEIKSYVK